jgi:hypothetical protein
MRNDAKGEGSKGGRVIGHTSGGRAIYESHSHPSHRDFTAGEHIAAASMHMARVEKLLDQASKKGSATHADIMARGGLHEQAQYHLRQSNLHHASADKVPASSGRKPKGKK